MEESAFMNTNQTIAELKIKLDSVYAQNERLSEENAKLKQENNRLRTENNVSSSVSIETRMRLHHFESERDYLKMELDELRAKYDKLYDRQQDQSLERFSKTLRKASFKHSHVSHPTQQTVPNPLKNEDESNELNAKLAEAQEIIATLQFELESTENELMIEIDQLKKELNKLKNDNYQQQKKIVSCTSSISSEDAIYDNIIYEDILRHGNRSSSTTTTSTSKRSTEASNSSNSDLPLPSRSSLNDNDDTTAMAASTVDEPEERQKAVDTVLTRRSKNVARLRGLIQDRLKNIYSGEAKNTD